MSRGVFVAGLVLAAVSLVVRATQKEHGALERNRVFAARVLGGHDPYARPPVHAPYPPSYGLVVAPLLVPPIKVARALWACLQLAGLAACWWLALRWWRGVAPTRAPPLFVPATVLLLGSRFLLRDMQGGGGNLVFGALVLFACFRPGEAPGTDRRPWLGAGLGIVLAAKPTPLLFLPWLWWRGRRRSVAVALGVAVTLHLATMLWLGPELFARAWATWIEGVWRYAARDDVFAPPALDLPPFAWMQQSLRCALARWLGEVPRARIDELPFFVPGLGLGPAACAWIWRALALAILALTLGACRRLARETSPFVELGVPALLFCATLCLSPIAWKAHHVQLLPVFFFLVAWLERRPADRRLLGGALGVYFVLCVLLSRTFLGETGQTLMESFYVVSLGALALLVLTLRVLRLAMIGARARARTESLETRS